MHTVTALAAVVFTCKDIDRSVRFYKALGVEVRETRHGGSGPHFTCSLGGVHFALYPTDDVERGAQSGVQIGLMVTNLDGAVAAVKAAGANVLQAPTPKPWGITAIVEDPDGRRVELVNTKVEQTGPMPF